MPEFAEGELFPFFGNPAVMSLCLPSPGPSERHCVRVDHCQKHGEIQSIMRTLWSDVGKAVVILAAVVAAARTEHAKEVGRWLKDDACLPLCVQQPLAVVQHSALGLSWFRETAAVLRIPLQCALYRSNDPSFLQEASSMRHEGRRKKRKGKKGQARQGKQQKSGNEAKPQASNQRGSQKSQKPAEKKPGSRSQKRASKKGQEGKKDRQKDSRKGRSQQKQKQQHQQQPGKDKDKDKNKNKNKHKNQKAEDKRRQAQQERREEQRDRVASQRKEQALRDQNAAMKRQVP